MLACIWRHVYGVQRQFGDAKELRFRNLNNDETLYIYVYVVLVLRKIFTEGTHVLDKKFIHQVYLSDRLFPNKNNG